jgi:hypothetical protein
MFHLRAPSILDLHDTPAAVELSHHRHWPHNFSNFHPVRLGFFAPMTAATTIIIAVGNSERPSKSGE